MRTLGKPQPWPVLPFMLLLIDGTVDLGLAEWLADMLPRCGDRTPLSQCCAVVHGIAAQRRPNAPQSRTVFRRTTS